MPFVHLHTHSEYSLLDGANRIPELVAHVKKLGMDSLAVTDHGNMHAAWMFYEHARAGQLRPILGFEATDVHWVYRRVLSPAAHR
jgi:DNA polymerase-3 subunit alpha